MAFAPACQAGALASAQPDLTPPPTPLPQVTEELLATFFADCGTVMDCRICGDPNSAMRFAFIEFSEDEAAFKARRAARRRRRAAAARAATAALFHRPSGTGWLRWRHWRPREHPAHTHTPRRAARRR